MAQDKIKKMFSEENESADLLAEDYEGQLALDAYQTEDEVVIKAPIAGVNEADLDVSITDDVLTIKGQRKQEQEIKAENFIAQECYWGSFSRSLTLPPGCLSDKSKATLLKTGVLIIRIPKKPEKKIKKLEIFSE
jgi:HSP20 family protein